MMGLEDLEAWPNTLDPFILNIFYVLTRMSEETCELERVKSFICKTVWNIFDSMFTELEIYHRLINYFFVFKSIDISINSISILSIKLPKLFYLIIRQTCTFWEVRRPEVESILCLAEQHLSVLSTTHRVRVVPCNPSTRGVYVLGIYLLPT